MAIEIFGLAAPIGVPSPFWTGRQTAFCPGAFADSLAVPFRESSIRLRLNHRTDAKIALRSDGDLGLSEVREGLFFSAFVGSPVWAGILANTAAIGGIQGVSLGWRNVRSTVRDGVEWVEAAAIEEISLMTHEHQPRFLGTSAAVEQKPSASVRCKACGDVSPVHASHARPWTLKEKVVAGICTTCYREIQKNRTAKPSRARPLQGHRVFDDPRVRIFDPMPVRSQQPAARRDSVSYISAGIQA